MRAARSSRTAEFMAFFRALESARPPERRLFEDPFAVAFLDPGLRRVARLAQWPGLGRALAFAIDVLWPGARPAGIARTRLIDDALEEAVARSSVRQVVLLGAGFDARAHRLAGLADVPVIELDHPDTLEEKRPRIGRLGLDRSPPVQYAPVDLDREPLADALAKAGFDPSRRSFFLWEGVTNYLSAEAVDAVLRFVAGTAPGTLLLFTYVHRDVLGEDTRFAATRRLRRTLRRAGEPWTFGLDPADLPSTLDACGLELVRDEGSRAYRERYLRGRERRSPGYEFYRAALARVP